MRTAPLFVAMLMAITPAALAQKGLPSRPPVEPRVNIPPAPRSLAPIYGQVLVGDTAPTFVLDGSLGRPVRLTSLRGGWLLLAFAERWQQLRGLDSIRTELKQVGAELAGVCHEKAQTLTGIAGRDSTSMLMLADVTGQVSATYGLFDLERGQTRPGFFIIDRRGVVQVALLGTLPPPAAVADLTRYIITGF